MGKAPHTLYIRAKGLTSSLSSSPYCCPFFSSSPSFWPLEYEHRLGRYRVAKMQSPQLIWYNKRSNPSLSPLLPSFFWSFLCLLPPSQTSALTETHLLYACQVLRFCTFHTLTQRWMQSHYTVRAMLHKPNTYPFKDQDNFLKWQ